MDLSAFVEKIDQVTKIVNIYNLSESFLIYIYESIEFQAITSEKLSDINNSAKEISCFSFTNFNRRTPRKYRSATSDLVMVRSKTILNSSNSNFN